MAVEEQVEPRAGERGARAPTSGSSASRSASTTIAAVDDVSLEIPRGSFFALLGPSGCGKTTSLRMIGGFEEPTAGTIYLGDRDVTGLPPYKRDVNTVFQSYALFPHLSIHDNVAFGLKRRGVKGAELNERVAEALELVALKGFERRKPRQLSGGQQQRVALARALVNRPRVLLLDEPLGALDLKLRKQMQLELKRIQHEVGITFVHVTHDQEEAMTMADTIAVMNAGRIEQLGTPTELYETPRTAFVAGFLGISNLLSGTVEGGDDVRLADGTVVRVPAVAGRSGEVAIGIRPEKVRLGRAGGEPPRRRGAGERLHRRLHAVHRRHARRRDHALRPEHRGRGALGAAWRTRSRSAGAPKRPSSWSHRRRRSHEAPVRADERSHHPRAAPAPGRRGRRHAVPARPSGGLRRRGRHRGPAAGRDRRDDGRAGARRRDHRLELALLHRPERRRDQVPRRSSSSPRRPESRSTTSRTSTRTRSSSARSRRHSRAASRSTGTSSCPPPGSPPACSGSATCRSSTRARSRTWRTSRTRSRAPPGTRTATTACPGSRTSPASATTPKKVGGELTSVEQLLDPALKGKITMLDSQEDTVGLFLLEMGVDPSAEIDPTAYDEAIAKVQKAVDDGQIRQFTGNDYTGPLAKGDVWASIAWSGDIVILQPDNPNLRVHDPGRRRNDVGGHDGDPDRRGRLHGLDVHELLLRPEDRGPGHRLRELHLARAAGRRRRSRRSSPSSPRIRSSSRRPRCSRTCTSTTRRRSRTSTTRRSGRP